MEISGEYLFDVPRHMVWNALQDPKVLGSILPGSQGFTQVGDNQFSGALLIKVGPVQGEFEGKITLSNFNAPESYWMVVEGSGATGVVHASGKLQLQERGNQTHMDYEGQAQVGGRIASVGQRLIDTAARSLIRQGLETLHEHLKLELQQQRGSPASTANAVSNAEAVSENKPPPQISLTSEEVQNNPSNLIPARYLPWLIGAAVIVIGLIVLLIASR